MNQISQPFWRGSNWKCSIFTLVHPSYIIIIDGICCRHIECSLTDKSLQINRWIAWIVDRTIVHGGDKWSLYFSAQINCNESRLDQAGTGWTWLGWTAMNHILMLTVRKCSRWEHKLWELGGPAGQRMSDQGWSTIITIVTINTVLGFSSTYH